MSSFEDRKKSFEKKFAHDEELQFKISARRNKYISQWVSSILGYDEEDTGSQDSHTNTPTNVTLLDNEYFLMCSPDLCGDFAEVEKHFVHIFAKIQNAARYGDVIFNSFVGGRKIFYNHEIDTLEKLEFKFQESILRINICLF